MKGLLIAPKIGDLIQTLPKKNYMGLILKSDVHQGVLIFWVSHIPGLPRNKNQSASQKLFSRWLSQNVVEFI